MKRLSIVFAVVIFVSPIFGVSIARADFGLSSFDVTFTNQDGTSATQAGSHPFAMTTALTTNLNEEGRPDGWLRDVYLEQIPGFVGDNTAYPRCTGSQFLEITDQGINACPLESTVGISGTELEPGIWFTAPVFNLDPPPGVVARLGFRALVENIVVDVIVDPDTQNLVAISRNTPQLARVFSNKTQLWGDPSSPAHDEIRGSCGATVVEGLTPQDPASFQFEGRGKKCPVEPRLKPFLTLPTNCDEPLASSYEAFSWGGNLPSDGAFDAGSVLTHGSDGDPQPFTGCAKLGFKPSITAAPTTKAASSPTGLDFSLDVKDEGLTTLNGLSQSTIRKAVVTLPEGMSANPSLAEGLEVCTEADLEDETLDAEPGQGCPQASKIGAVEVETPLIEESVKGALYIAKPYENPFDSLLALYIVLRNPELGIIVKQSAKVIPDPVTGRLTTVTEDIPQLPFSHFRLHFREGARSPLASPPSCGSHDVQAVLYPWSGTEPITTTSTFALISGPGEGPCPKGGLPPFKPGLLAGTVNNRAGSFSPFNVKISRTDSEQEITHFSIKLPPGIVGKLAGVPYCSDAAIAAAKARTGPHGGQEELDDPSCPAASEVGRSLAGAGVGPALTYAPGKIYLAGPYNGSKLSIVAITAGVVGPFDIGTVVIREALEINPETAEVFVDATGSDPIPHIIRGIQVHLRDIRAYVDRHDFVLNPTDCTRTSTASTALGSGLDFVSEADDNPITVTSPFQAADCAALPFKPQLGLRLNGGTKRGAHPAFHAHLEMSGIGEAGIAYSQVTLPRSEFIENAHFKTICTRVQFKAGAGNGSACPADSIYGHARAVTPILDEPLEGPVFLRSSEHQLPDLVIALHNSQVDFDLVGRVDSVKGGGLRNTFEAAPDAPVSSFDLWMAGGKKGLFVNSTNLCAKTYRAKSLFTGQNGKTYKTKPALKAKCPKARKHKKAQKRPQLRAAG